ncbi:MAG TPA: hypothetical protein VGQ53_14780 [Chitinophagaceae bacterium]|jgi:hypothetical protein|nr:hypothetical protein [Chitinophagaceae bacterium]
MKLILENIFWSQRSLLFWVGFLFACVTSTAQDTTVTETVVEEADSAAITIDQADTNYEHQSNFEHKAALTDTIELRQVPGSIIDSLKKDEAFWYADHVFAKKEAKEKSFSPSKPPLQWINMTTLLVIVVLFLGILAWYLLQNNIVGRRQSIVAEKVSEEITGENIFEINYQKEIEKAVTAGDYRLAIRLMFLRLLKQLSQKKIIEYKQERTNFDYLSQLYPTGYYNDFFRLTRNYEYTWYGKFDVSRETFGVIKNEFENFDRKLS